MKEQEEYIRDLKQDLEVATTTIELKETEIKELGQVCKDQAANLVEL